MMPLPSSLTLTVETGRDSAYLRLTGDLDFSTGDAVAERAEQCLTEQPGLQDLHIDCAELTFCDSIGVSSFLMIHRHTTAHSARLHLDNQPSFLRRLLDITGTQHLFTQPCTAQQAE
ncbi:STAS domain-containing protein [Streptomyces sp. NBC_00102]|uniref:STAS domain-containing protein n=1 Tax=Streptomyces sp. NBC_00102 TaxID=2975652 RepID=UPI00225A6BC6|nr:STAS domain-containing protein [Streptomyces sp. NBC_00102]MCX5401571.1 STAS domain-containing protein [Streptomyces sp. NBC_00102]